MFKKEISSLSSNSGSVLGGTVLTINGPFLYTDSTVPAYIQIAGSYFKHYFLSVIIYNKKLFSVN